MLQAQKGDFKLPSNLPFAVSKLFVIYLCSACLVSRNARAWEGNNRLVIAIFVVKILVSNAAQF
jgi:hypothetical protein